MKTSKQRRRKALKPRVWGLGLVALDLIIDSHSHQPRLAAGGTCGNVMIILSRLGWESTPIARLAHDPAAALVTTDMARFGVNTHLVNLRPSARTPVVVEKIRKDSSGIPFHTFSFVCPSCGTHLPRYQPVTSASVEKLSSKMSHLDVLFIDRASRGALSVAEAASKCGAVVFFEPSAGSSPKHLAEMLEIAHVVKYSHDRIPDTDELDWGANMVLEIQTLGRGGLRFRTTLGGKKHRVWRSLPAVPATRFQDAAGAGDWLSGALIHNLCPGGAKRLNKRGFDELVHGLNFGQGLAAWNCGFPGARGSMYTVPEDQFRKVLRTLQLGRAIKLVTETATSDEFLRAVEAICESCRPIGNGRRNFAVRGLSMGLA